MAQKSKPRTKHKSSYRGFEGVDLKKTHSGDESICMIDNFRITSDGSLKKRSGLKKLYSGSTDISASLCVTQNGIESCYFVQGNAIRKYTPHNDQTNTVDKLENIGSNAFFFEYFDNVYFCNGYSIFSVQSSLNELSGYIPLYGKNWASGAAGEINEPANLLSDKLAISYKLTTPAVSVLHLGEYPISEVCELYRNGVLLDADSYSLNKTYNVINVQTFAENDEFFAIVKMDTNEKLTNERNTLLSERAAEIFYELNENNLFFWGSDSSNKIYYTRKPDPESAKTTEKYTSAGSFYVPAENQFSVASDNDRVKALIRHYDRILIMTERSTWISDPNSLNSESNSIRSINTSIGCESFNGAARLENTLVSVGKSSIYSWTSQTDELNECNAYSISDPINELLPEDFFSTCKIYVYKKKHEIWLYGSSPKQVWIYNLDRKAWYKFSGFIPNEILYGGSEPRLFENGSLFCFDDSLSADHCSDEPAEITAKIKSGELEFNSKHKKKLSGATLRGEFSGGTLDVSITLDGEKTFATSITPSAKHFVFPFRIRSGSFSSLSFELTARGDGDQIIHGVEFDAD